MKLLLPACNSFQDSAHGCLFGIPPEFYGGTQRGCLDVLLHLYRHLKPHFPKTDFGRVLQADYLNFIESYGLRPSYLNGPSNPKTRNPI